MVVVSVWIICCVKWRIERWILYSFLIRCFFLTGRTLKSFRAGLVKCDLKKLLLRGIVSVSRLQYFVVSRTVGVCTFSLAYCRTFLCNWLHAELERSLRIISNLNRRKVNHTGCAPCQVYWGLRLAPGRVDWGWSLLCWRKQMSLPFRRCVWLKESSHRARCKGYWLALSAEDTVFHLRALSINFFLCPCWCACL